MRGSGETRITFRITHLVYSSLLRMWYLRMILFSCRELSHFQFRKSTFFSSFCSWNFSFRTMIVEEATEVD